MKKENVQGKIPKTCLISQNEHQKKTFKQLSKNDFEKNREKFIF